jgi:hypothetical protein
VSAIGYSKPRILSLPSTLGLPAFFGVTVVRLEQLIAILAEVSRNYTRTEIICGEIPHVVVTNAESAWFQLSCRLRNGSDRVVGPIRVGFLTEQGVQRAVVTCGPKAYLLDELAPQSSHDFTLVSSCSNSLAPLYGLRYKMFEGYEPRGFFNCGIRHDYGDSCSTGSQRTREPEKNVSEVPAAEQSLRMIAVFLEGAQTSLYSKGKPFICSKWHRI